MPHVLAVYFPLVVLGRCCLRSSLQSLQRPQLFGHDHCTGLLGSKQDQSLSGLTLASILIFHFSLLKRLYILAREIFGSIPTLPPGSHPQQLFSKVKEFG